MTNDSVIEDSEPSSGVEATRRRSAELFAQLRDDGGTGLAAAAELRRTGSSTAVVCTQSSRTGAVATYRSAGYHQLPDRRDRTRSA